MSAFGPEVQPDGALALPCWIGGHAYLALADRYFDVQGNSGVSLRRVPLCGEAPVLAAVEAALPAVVAWRALAAEEREARFVELHALLVRYRAHLAKLIAEECGFAPELADAELRDALAAISGTGLAPLVRPAEPPVVAAIIAGAGTPLAAATACAVEALAAGWAVILKPSLRAPSALLALAEVFSRAGFPGGLVNLVHGDEDVIAALCASEAVKAVVCTSNDGVAEKVRPLAADRAKPFVSGAPGDELLAAWRRCLGLEA